MFRGNLQGVPAILEIEIAIEISLPWLEPNHQIFMPWGGYVSSSSQKKCDPD